MKRRQAKTILREWQDRLRLNEWTLTLETVKGRVLPRTKVLGNIVWDVNSATATVAVALGRPERDVADTIRHELLHLRLADFMATALTACNDLPRPHRKLASTLLERAEERAVRALEKALSEQP